MFRGLIEPPTRTPPLPCSARRPTPCRQNRATWHRPNRSDRERGRGLHVMLTILRSLSHGGSGEVWLTLRLPDRDPRPPDLDDVAGEVLLDQPFRRCRTDPGRAGRTPRRVASSPHRSGTPRFSSCEPWASRRLDGSQRTGLGHWWNLRNRRRNGPARRSHHRARDFSPYRPAERVNFALVVDRPRAGAIRADERTPPARRTGTGGPRPAAGNVAGPDPLGAPPPLRCPRPPILPAGTPAARPGRSGGPTGKCLPTGCVGRLETRQRRRASMGRIRGASAATEPPSPSGTRCGPAGQSDDLEDGEDESERDQCGSEEDRKTSRSPSRCDPDVQRRHGLRRTGPNLDFIRPWDLSADKDVVAHGGSRLGEQHLFLAGLLLP